MLNLTSMKGLFGRAHNGSTCVEFLINQSGTASFDVGLLAILCTSQDAGNVHAYDWVS